MPLGLDVAALLLSALAPAGAVTATDLTTGPLLPESSRVDQPGVAQLADLTTPLVLDLQRPERLVGLVLQADADDVYWVEASADGRTWRTIWRVPRIDGGRPGLRTRSLRLPSPVEARLLSVRATVGSPPYAVARLYPLEAIPASWPPPLDYSLPSSRLPRFAFFTPAVVLALKGALGAVGLLLFARLAERRRRGAALGGTRALLVSTAILSALAWTNALNFHYAGGLIHWWDTYHYYVASKYFPELGYDALYACSASAEAEDGRAEVVRARTLRDLRADTVVSAAPWVDDVGPCRTRFTEGRWAEFRHDVAFFRGAMGDQAWASSQTDHGFNATPVWAMVGGLLARTGPATWEQITILSCLDLGLILLLLGIVAFGFGMEAACAAAIYFGVNGLSPFAWTGGAFLRYDWLLLAGLGVAALRKERPFLAGFCIAWSALIRVFPGFLLAGIALAALIDAGSVRSWRPILALCRLAAGAVCAVAILVPASVLAVGRWSAWGDFETNTRRFVATEAPNFVGLQVLASYRPDLTEELATDPLRPDANEAWRRSHAEATRSAAPFVWAARASALILFALAVRRRPPWVAALLGLALVPLVFKLANYYYSCLALLGALAASSPAAALGLVALAWSTNMAVGTWPSYEEAALATSLLVVAFDLGLLVALARGKPDVAAPTP